MIFGYMIFGVEDTYGTAYVQSKETFSSQFFPATRGYHQGQLNYLGFIFTYYSEKKNRDFKLALL